MPAFLPLIQLYHHPYYGPQQLAAVSALARHAVAPEPYCLRRHRHPRPPTSPSLPMTRTKAQGHWQRHSLTWTWPAPRHPWWHFLVPLSVQCRIRTFCLNKDAMASTLRASSRGHQDGGQQRVPEPKPAVPRSVKATAMIKATTKKCSTRIVEQKVPNEGRNEAPK